MAKLEGINGTQKAAQDVREFKRWLKKMNKDKSKYVEIIHRGILKRSIVAEQSGILVGQLTKNKEIKRIFKKVENGLRTRGVLPTKTIQGKQQGAKPILDKESIKRAKSESRVPALEQKILELESEIAMLKGKLGRFSEHAEVMQELSEL